MTTKTNNGLSIFVGLLLVSVVIVAGNNLFKPSKDKSEELNTVRLSTIFKADHVENNHELKYSVNLKEYYVGEKFESWEEMFVVKPGDRIKLEAWQDTNNFLQCSIYYNGRLVDFAHRNDAGKCLATYLVVQ